MSNIEEKVDKTLERGIGTFSQESSTGNLYQPETVEEVARRAQKDAIRLKNRFPAGTFPY